MSRRRRRVFPHIRGALTSWSLGVAISVVRVFAPRSTVVAMGAAGAGIRGVVGRGWI